MCGIMGYVGPGEAAPLLLEGLRRLEYRGYDSAGVVVLHDGQLVASRAEGKLENLVEKLHQEPLSGSYGLGHTRWATHGAPLERSMSCRKVLSYDSRAWLISSIVRIAASYGFRC